LGSVPRKRESGIGRKREIERKTFKKRLIGEKLLSKELKLYKITF
jgi:hypothetical protein